MSILQRLVVLGRMIVIDQQPPHRIRLPRRQVDHQEGVSGPMAAPSPPFVAIGGCAISGTEFGRQAGYFLPRHHPRRPADITAADQILETLHRRALVTYRFHVSSR